MLHTFLTKHYKTIQRCVKTLLNVTETREVCLERVKWQSLVSAYPNGNPQV